VKSDPNVTERALGRVLSEARAEAMPELDWERVEARLDEVPRMPLTAEPPSRAVRAGMYLAAAGLLLAVGWVAAGGRTPMATPSSPAPESGLLDGNTFAAGSRVEATTEDVSVEHAHHSRWTLERGGRALVTTTGAVVRIELQAGSLAAEVVPSPKPETFVVEAAGTRVAVHGTAFRVALTAGEVVVSVSEGTVLVGPRARPGAGRPVSANESSTFSLDGVPMGAARTANAEKNRPASDRRGTTIAGKHRDLVERPSIDDVEKVVSQVFELGSSCFRSRTASKNGVRVTATTTITLNALPTGALELVGLEPPLAPPVQACISDGVRKLSTTESQHGISIARRMDLEQ
jgi:ferric-dicitrate binding protein FerR (iron transport regulator)